MLVRWQHHVALKQCHVLRLLVVIVVVTIAITVVTIVVMTAAVVARKNAVGGNSGKTKTVVQNAIVAVIRG